MKKNIFSEVAPFLTLFFSFLSIALSGQTVNPALGPIYDDTVVPRIDILIDVSSLQFILDPDNIYSEELFEADFIFDNGSIRDTIENVGFKLRGNSSLSAQKKSFKISFNKFVPGRNYYGLEKMNLNGEKNDPAIMRSKTCLDICRNFNIPAARSNHVEFYINGEYRGLYINVEHIDENFIDSRFQNENGNLYKCLWPADLNYIDWNPNSYKFAPFGRRTYDLEINREDDDYADIANFIDVLNNTEDNDLPCSLEKVFNVDAYLKAMAMDILTGNWDGPLININNFYLYHNQSTGLFEYIPYDFDNTLGIEWIGSNTVDRDIYNWDSDEYEIPLYFRLMDNAEYKARFTFYLNQFIEDFYNDDYMHSRIDDLKAMIQNAAEADNYRTMDFGFSIADFNNCYEMEIGGHVEQGLKEYISLRANSALEQMDLVPISPIISNLHHNHPLANEDVFVRAQVLDDVSLDVVELHYIVDGQSGIQISEMFDDGLHGDGDPGDGIYGLTIPALNEDGVFGFYISAQDAAGNESRYPRCDYKELYVGFTSLPLRINEIMASNNSIEDEWGEYDDWIEIYNFGEESIYLGDKYLSDNSNLPNKWRMPDTWLEPGGFYLFWADKDEEQGQNHCNFKLAASGESVGIYDSDANLNARIDELSYGAQDSDIPFGRLPNGTGDFQSLETPTPGFSNEPIAVMDLEIEAGYAAYPNPFSYGLNICVDNLKGWKRVEISVKHISGSLVYSKQFEASGSFQYYWEPEQMRNGLYFVSVKVGPHLLSEKKVVYFKK